MRAYAGGEEGREGVAVVGGEVGEGFCGDGAGGADGSVQARGDYGGWLGRCEGCALAGEGGGVLCGNTMRGFERLLRSGWRDVLGGVGGVLEGSEGGLVWSSIA